MNILILCTGNSCRSQMAHGYLEFMCHNEHAIYSAGIETHGVNPGAVSIMKDDGIDISHHTSNHVDEYIDVNFDLILTVCDHAQEKCPYFPSKAKRLHQNFPDPAKASGTDLEVMKAFKHTRDLIKVYCSAMVKEYGLNAQQG